MKIFLRSYLSRIFALAIFSPIKKIYYKNQLDKWKNSPIGPAPHIFKQITIQKYQQQSKSSVLIETGTFLGDMVAAQLNSFKTIYSIEVSYPLFIQAKSRFRKSNSKVKILQGDSGVLLPEIVKDLKERAIFWLDGHYSGGITSKGESECPIIKELSAILPSTNAYEHIILIDDARCFTGEGDYPSMEVIKSLVSKANSKYSVKVENDIIRILSMDETK